MQDGFIFFHVIHLKNDSSGLVKNFISFAFNTHFDQNYYAGRNNFVGYPHRNFNLFMFHQQNGIRDHGGGKQKQQYGKAHHA